MSFIHNNETAHLLTRITNKGRQKIAQGDFNIVYFQVGDSEFDYNFSSLDGTSLTSPAQKIFTPLDKDATVKYPYKLSESTVTGTTFGNPIQNSEVKVISNYMGPAGFVSAYTGASIVCATSEINITKLNGTTLLQVPTGNTFSDAEFITILFDRLVGVDTTISGYSNSLVFKIVSGTTGATYDTLTLDRITPNMSAFSGTITVIGNKCDPFLSSVTVDPLVCTPIGPDPEDQQDPWTLSIVWGTKPAGMDVPATIDESLSGYTSNVFASTKEFLGYNTSSGQTVNSGTTITNTIGELIVVTPEEQHSLGIVYYDEINSDYEPEKYFKYEDYIGHTETADIEYFEVYIPFMLYHRNTGTTIGARFFMDTVDHYINSTASDTKQNKFKYRYLKDEFGNNVGRVLVHNKTIIFDDQEIVAALEYKSNRRHTLPAPKVNLVPGNMKCGTNLSLIDPLMDGTTGQTMFLSYLFEITGQTGMTGMHCNYYSKLVGTTTTGDASIQFGPNEFRYMSSGLTDYTEGFIANKFSILAQMVDTGDQPTTDGWKIIDFTSEIPGHTVGTFIDPVNIRNTMYILDSQQYDDAIRYDLEDYLGIFPDEPSTLPEFGDKQPFPGSVKLVRSTDIQVMKFMINLPSGEFESTQNPSWTSGKIKRVTEVALLDSNKDVLVISKAGKPIVRSGTQVLEVKLDF
jgi:hypothetical protein